MSFSKEPSFLKKDSAEQMVSQDILKRMEEEPTGDFIPIIRSKLINTGASSSNTRSPSELDLSCIHAGFKKPMTSKELEQSEKPKMHSDLLSKLPTTKCSI